MESPAGEQNMHLPVGEEQGNQTREKIVYPQSVFAAPVNGEIQLRSSCPCPDGKSPLVGEVEGFILKQ